MEYTWGPLIVRRMILPEGFLDGACEKECVYSPKEDRIIAVTGQAGDLRSHSDALLFSVANDLTDICRSILHQFETDQDLDLCVSNPGIYDLLEERLREILSVIDGGYQDD